MCGSEKLKIPYPVIVEGKYDRLRLCTVIDAKIITTDGFGIFRNDEKKALIRAIAKKNPVIVLTDPDGAGKVIRSAVSGILPPDRVIRLYVPRIAGKEKRKSAPSAEGVLGVEGMEKELLYGLFLPYTDENAAVTGGENPLCAADLFADGLTGTPDSRTKRDEFAKKLGLPEGMNAKAFLAALRLILTYDEYLSMTGRIPAAEDNAQSAEKENDQ